MKCTNCDRSYAENYKGCQTFKDILNHISSLKPEK